MVKRSGLRMAAPTVHGIGLALTVSLSWCAERGVSLILHGHKHVPHHVQATISAGSREHSMVVVGCGSTTGAEARPLCYDGSRSIRKTDVGASPFMKTLQMQVRGFELKH